MAYHAAAPLILAALVASAVGKSPEHGRRVVCYMASWGPVLAGDGRFDISDAEPALPFCTHLVYLFANLSPDSVIIPLDRQRDIDQGGYKAAVALKKNNPHVRVMIGLGGWVDGSEKYSIMARDPQLRRKFLDSVVQFLSEYKLDGLDLNWQFPGERGGISADKANLVALTREMRRAFDKRGWVLSVAVSAFPARINAGVDIAALADNAHFLNILSYEYHTTWGGLVGPSAPLFARDNFSVSDTIENYIRQGAAPYKLNVGISSYGTDFNLANPFANGTVIGQRVTGHGFKGTFNDVPGFMAYNELCLEFAAGGWELVEDEGSQTPFARNFDRVVSYDNPKSINAKIRYAMERQLGGVIFYGLEKDDFKMLCSPTPDGSTDRSTAYPLLNAIHSSLVQHSSFDYIQLRSLLRKYPAKYFWNGYKE